VPYPTASFVGAIKCVMHCVMQCVLQRVLQCVLQRVSYLTASSFGATQVILKILKPQQLATSFTMPLGGVADFWD